MLLSSFVAIWWNVYRSSRYIEGNRMRENALRHSRVSGVWPLLCSMPRIGGLFHLFLFPGVIMSVTFSKLDHPPALQLTSSGRLLIEYSDGSTDFNQIATCGLSFQLKNTLYKALEAMLYGDELPTAWFPMVQPRTWLVTLQCVISCQVQGRIFVIICDATSHCVWARVSFI